MFETTSYPGEAAECASAVSDVLSSVERLASVSSNLTDVELTSVAQSLVVMMQQAEASLVALTTDAIGRGVIDRSTAANASHHRIVHRDHLTATVTDHAVTWHYTKGVNAA